MWILTVFLLAAGGDRAVNSYGLFDSKEHCVSVSQEVGKDLKESVSIAKRFVNEAIRTAPMIGRGNSPINIKPI